MDQRTLKLIIGSVLIVATFVAVFARENLGDAIYLATYGLVAVALAALGVLGGARALPVFAVTYAVGCVLWQAFWWTDAPELSGIDDIPPVGGFFVTVPFALIVITAGWAVASAARTLSVRR